MKKLHLIGAAKSLVRSIYTIVFISILYLCSPLTLVHASLIGDTATCSMTIGVGFCTPVSATVSGAVEFEAGLNNVTAWSVDVGESDITINNIFGNFFCANCGEIVIGDLDWVDNPSSIIVGISDFFSPSPDIIEADLVFTEHSVSLNLNDSSWGAGDSVSFSLVTELAPVPLPPAVWLFGSGLLGLIGISRRKKIA